MTIDLYPELYPYRELRLPVELPHELYVEECGNPKGLPVVFLHGGPGAGCEPYHRRFFNPERYRIVLFDQRGCGRSEPHAELRSNNTDALIEDIERIRRRLGIERWVVFGGSWGSTLGLAYAQCYPERALGLILRGVFLCRRQDIQWFYQEGANWLFPDYWRDFIFPIPPGERSDLLAAYHRRLTGSDELGRMAAAKAWSIWEGRTATLASNPSVVTHFANPRIAYSMARIESHYFINQAFLKPGQLLDNMSKIQNVPGTIVHGRYDVICPLQQAYELHHAWPDSKLIVVSDAGHSATEPGIARALVNATDEMATAFN